MITIDITLLIHIVNMIVLMFILNAVLYKPILSILEKRAQRLDSLQGEVEQFEMNAQEQQAALDHKMREASARAKKALDEAKAKAQATGAEQLAAIRTAADEDKKKALESAHEQVQAARKALQESTSDFASAMAEKILGRSLKA